MEHKHTITVIVHDKPGVLSRVAGLFSRRGFNIESLAVGTSETPGLSRMTIVAKGDDEALEQIMKQLYKLIDVLRVYDMPTDTAVEREIVLAKVHANANTRAEINQIVEIFRANIVNVGEDSMIIEMTGESSKVEGILKLLEKFGIQELVRTGKIAMLRS
ncbi:MAG: acetolactate synthase small subunit [Candidatus Saganbacteria bacterium]|nr:acetolactate synthase small subunit [Candidatus Saganbacteria bacterium]